MYMVSGAMLVMVYRSQVNEIMSNWKSQTLEQQTSNKTQVAVYNSSFRKAQFFFFPGIVEHDAVNQSNA